MGIKFKNNAKSTLLGAINNTQTTLTVAAGDGAEFPVLAVSGDYFYATLVDASDASVVEVVKVTARSGDVFTIARGQDGTSAKAFDAADKVELRVTAAVLQDVLSEAQTLAQANDARAAAHAGQFQHVSSTQCKLAPYRGDKVPVKSGGSWITLQIPAAGVAFNNTSLSANTTYYAYVYDDGGTLAAEWSTTGHATDADTGIEIKSGDATRTLVGLVRTISGAQFIDSETFRNVASWNNQKPRSLVNEGSGAATTTSSTYAGISPAITAVFVTFGSGIMVTVGGGARIDTLSSNGWVAVALDSTVVPQAGSNFDQEGTVSTEYPSFATMAQYVAEGHHTLDMYARVIGGGTLTYWAANHGLVGIV